MTYLDSPWYSQASSTKSPFGAGQLPKELLHGHMEAMQKGKIVTGAFPPDRMPLCLCALQQGAITTLLGEDDSLFLDRVAKKLEPREKVPFLFLYHGTEDSGVPCDQSRRFVQDWKERFGEHSGTGAFVPGDHGFDESSTLETDWLKAGLKSVTEKWLG